MNIVLVEPEIPPNTGNIARLCAATRSTLHLIEPFGFKLDDRRLKRAGLDYWEHLAWHRWAGWRGLSKTTARRRAPLADRIHGARHYAQAEYQPGDYLVFGRETAGLPKKIIEQYRDRWLRIPMFHGGVRSLNLSNCVALVLYEALRQQGFEGEV